MINTKASHILLVANRGHADINSCICDNYLKIVSQQSYSSIEDLNNFLAEYWETHPMLENGELVSIAEFVTNFNENDYCFEGMFLIPVLIES